MAITVRPSVPPSHASESEHRRQIANVVNIINQTTPDYSRTDAEIAAGVTPVDLRYPPGDVKRYGATANDSSDDTQAIQTAINSENITITFPPGTYNISASLTGMADAVVQGEGAVLSATTTTSPVINLSGADGAVVQGFEVTQNFDPQDHDINSPTSEQAQAIRALSTTRNVRLLWMDIHNTSRQAIFATGSENWKVIGCYAKDLSREFWFSNADSVAPILALNHINNPGDDTFALNGNTRYGIVGLNFVDYDGLNHTTSVTGGGPLKIHSSYNVVVGNVTRNVSAWFCQFFNGTDANGDPVSPTGNLIIGNVCHVSMLDAGNTGTVGLYTVRPSTNGINKSANNFLVGGPTIDGVVWRGVSNVGAPDVGGVYIFEGDIFRDVRHGVLLSSGNGGSLIFRNCWFLELTGEDVLAVVGSSGRMFEEVIFEGCVFGWANSVTQRSIVRLADINFSLDRLVMRRNRVLTGNGEITQAVITLGSSSIGSVVDEDNEWTETA